MPEAFTCKVCNLPRETALLAYACAMQETPAPLSGTVLYQFGAATEPTRARIRKKQIMSGTHRYIYLVQLAKSRRIVWAVPEEDFIKVQPVRLYLVSNAA